MLRLIILPVFLFSFSELGMVYAQNRSCPAGLQEDSPSESSLKIVETVQKDKEFQSFLSESSQKKDAVLRDKEFQSFVTNIQSQMPLQTTSHNKSEELYVFVSFSLGEKALENLAHEAGRYGATLVLRGFRDGSYGKTAQALQNIILKTGQGFIIDPELFTLFGVKAVPTFVLAKPFSLTTVERTQTPLHDRLQGHVSVHYVLESFSKEGDCKAEAQFLLEKEGTK